MKCNQTEWNERNAKKTECSGIGIRKTEWNGMKCKKTSECTLHSSESKNQKQG